MWVITRLGSNRTGLHVGSPGGWPGWPPDRGHLWWPWCPDPGFMLAQLSSQSGCLFSPVARGKSWVGKSLKCSVVFWDIEIDTSNTWEIMEDHGFGLSDMTVWKSVKGWTHLPTYLSIVPDPQPLSKGCVMKILGTAMTRPMESGSGFWQANDLGRYHPMSFKRHLFPAPGREGLTSPPLLISDLADLAFNKNPEGWDFSHPGGQILVSLRFSFQWVKGYDITQTVHRHLRCPRVDTRSSPRKSRQRLQNRMTSCKHQGEKMASTACNVVPPSQNLIPKRHDLVWCYLTSTVKHYNL